LRAQDLRTLRGHTSGRKEIAHATWDWMVQNFDGLVARIGAKAAPGLPQFAGAFCSGAEAAQVEAFFASKAAVIPSGIERTLAQTLETIRACEVSRARYGAEARAWYQR
jgi:alanyl aminopeptidase